MCVALVVIVLSVVDGRLVFPAGTDMGYIVPDEPEPERYIDPPNWLSDIEEYRAEPLRGEREAVDSTVESLWRRLNGLEGREEEGSFENGEWENQVDSREGRSESESEHQSDNMRISPPKDLPDILKDDKHGVAMGISHAKCDNAKINLTIDWDYSPVNYTCFNMKHRRIPVLEGLRSVKKCAELAKNYTPQHVCMNQKLYYNSTLPTFGPHRPIWPVFGEYKFVPVQRWLHSLEHGGIVMLYDPCTQPLLVDRLRQLLVGCFRKHIITPYTLLTKERPLALLAWGCSLEMATIDESEVKSFIKKYALHGPEGHYPKNGGFKEGLIHKAEYLPGYDNDTVICPENVADEFIHYLR